MYNLSRLKKNINEKTQKDLHIPNKLGTKHCIEVYQNMCGRSQHEEENGKTTEDNTTLN
jgi:hypothetical protein